MEFEVREYIKESNAIEDIFDETEVEQSLKAWNYLDSLGPVISHKDICEVQKIIVANQPLLDNEKGFYRSHNGVWVSVGGVQAPAPSRVDNLIQKWLLDLPKMSTLVAHIRFEYVHPFVDGNGRTGRMLYWWHCRQKEIKPKLFTRDGRQKYYSMFSKKKIKALKSNNWGIDYMKETWVVTVKMRNGSLENFVVYKKPKDSDIAILRKQVPNLQSVLRIKRIEKK